MNVVTIAAIAVAAFVSTAGARRYRGAVRAISQQLDIEWQPFLNRAAGRLDGVGVVVSTDNKTVVVELDGRGLPAGFKVYALTGRPNAPTQCTGDLEFDGETSWEPSAPEQIALMTPEVRNTWHRFAITGVRFHLVDQRFVARFGYLDAESAADSIRDMAKIVTSMLEANAAGPDALRTMTLTDPHELVRKHAFEVLASSAVYAATLESMVEAAADLADHDLRLRIYLAASNREAIEREVTARQASADLLAHAESLLATLPNPKRY